MAVPISVADSNSRGGYCKKKARTMKIRAGESRNRGKGLRRANDAPGRRCHDDGCGLDRGLDDLGLGDGARRTSGLHHEAALECLIDAALDLERFLPHDLRHLGDDERLGTIEHALLTE